MTFTPYLHFRGTCAEAMTFYADVFGADNLTLMPFSDAPEDVGVPANSKRIMNSHMTVRGAALMASDFPDDVDGDPQKAVSISFWAEDTKDAERIFERLLVGGDTIMALQKTFWSPGFGMVRDRFGTHWMISVPSSQDQPSDTHSG